MASLKGIALLLICVCIQQHFLQANAQAKKGKGRQRQQSLSPKPTSPPRFPKKSSGPKADSALFKGRISNKDGTRCTWAATESSIDDDGAFVLSISCKKGAEKRLQCEYTAKPRLCPEYTSNVDAFWKQIGRSFKRQKNLCRDSKALLKAKMCRKAPKGAHFALGTRPKVQTTSARKNKSCANLKDRKKLAEEYCGSSWSSFCTFFFAMVETEDC